MPAPLTRPDDETLHFIIHAAAATAGGVGAGMAQLPGADGPAIALIQAGMIRSLAQVFNIHPTQEMTANLLLPFAATMAGRQVAGFLTALLPGAGNAANAVTAASITEAVGWAAVGHFRQLR